MASTVTAQKTSGLSLPTWQIDLVNETLEFLGACPPGDVGKMVSVLDLLVQGHWPNEPTDHIVELVEWFVLGFTEAFWLVSLAEAERR